MRWMHGCGVAITGSGVFVNIMITLLYILDARCFEGKCDGVDWLWILILWFNFLLNMFTYNRIFKNDRNSMLVWIIFQIALLIAITMGINQQVFPELLHLLFCVFAGYLIITIPIMTVARWKLRGYTFDRPSPTQYNASHRPRTTNRPNARTGRTPLNSRDKRRVFVTSSNTRSYHHYNGSGPSSGYRSHNYHRSHRNENDSIAMPNIQFDNELSIRDILRNFQDDDTDFGKNLFSEFDEFRECCRDFEDTDCGKADDCNRERDTGGFHCGRGDTGGYDCGGGDSGGGYDFGGDDTGGGYDFGGDDTGGGYDYGGGDADGGGDTGGGYDYGGGDTGGSYDYGGGDTGGGYDYGGGDTGGSYDYGGGDTGGSYDYGGGDTGGGYDCGGNDD